MSSNFERPCRPGIDTELLKQIYYVIMSYCSKEQNTEETNFKVLHNLNTFAKFANNTCELQTCQVSTMNESSKKSFWINIYNTLLLHLYVQVGFPTSSFAKKIFFNNYKYKIGQFSFSLSDIENGILRGNPSKPFSIHKHFRSGDRRRLFVLPLDPRFHFSLSDLTVLSPPLNPILPDNLDEILTFNTTKYLTAQVEVDLVKKEVFNFYFNFILILF